MANKMTTGNLSLADHDPSKSVTTPRENIPGLPDFGWRVKLDYECQEKCKPFTTPRLRQLPALIGLGLRYSSYMLKCRRQGRRPHMDHTNPVYHKPIYERKAKFYWSTLDGICTIFLMHSIGHMDRTKDQVQSTPICKRSAVGSPLSCNK